MTRIEINPKILSGKPVIKGTRIPVYLILKLLASGYSTEKIVKSYPSLKKEDVKAAVKYASSILETEEIKRVKLVRKA